MSSQDLRVMGDVRDALGSSLDIREVLERATPLLRHLIPADYAALGTTPPGRLDGLEWIVADMPEAFFNAYPEIASHDFVLRSVLAAPNRVLRDADMIPRRELESNAMYHAARDLGFRLEQVMSVMLHVDDTWRGGISLYRSERRPFSEREQRLLQELAPALTNAVRNCRRFAEAQRRSDLLEVVLSRGKQAALVLAESGREIARTDSARRLLEQWCPGSRREVLPEPVMDPVRRWLCGADDAASTTVVLAGGARLILRPHWIHQDHLRYLIVSMDGPLGSPSLPPRWREGLTPRELEVAAGAVRGWDSPLIAQELGCAPTTVKKHLSRIFAKLAVESQVQLMARAADEHG